VKRAGKRTAKGRSWGLGKGVLAREGRSRGKGPVGCGREREGRLVVVGWLLADGRDRSATDGAGQLGPGDVGLD